MKENSSAGDYFRKLTSATHETLVSKWKTDIEQAEAVRESSGNPMVIDIMKNKVKKHQFFTLPHI